MKSSFSPFLHFYSLQIALANLFFETFTCFNPKWCHKHFQNRSLCWTELKENKFPWRHPCMCTPIDHRQRPITARVAFTSLYNVRCYRYLSLRIIYILPWHDWEFKVSLKFKSFINTRESHGPSFVLRLLKISLTKLLSSVRWTIPTIINYFPRI